MTRMPGFHDYVGWLHQRIVPTLLISLITAAVIGSTTYLLFEREKDLQKFDSAMHALKEEDIRESSFNNMLDLVSDGWLAPTTHNTATTEHLIDTISDHAQHTTLFDETFVSESNKF